MDLDKVYEPQRFEPRWAQEWVERNLYQANPAHTGKVFSLVIPPPNVTGSLHMGHMLEHTEIDTTIRHRRMLGENVLWLPGTDHAGIATQMVVERELAKENIYRRDLGREAFEAKVWEYKELYGGTIVNQMKRTGTSCDWSRARFTLDPGLSRAVRETFVNLYEKGLIYRGEYMVNWDPVQGTAVSDLEVTHEEVNGHLWHIRYPVEGSDRFLVVATTRPETMLGDSAVAINARDERYLDLHSKSVRLPLMDRSIPIVLDDLADPEFGTGVVKVTPAHDPNDFECGKRHNLARIQVIGLDGKMTANAGPYAGMDRFEARKAVVAKLDELGLLEKVQDHKLSVGRGQRSKAILEPQISLQWFCQMKPLAEPAIKAVEDGTITFFPENWAKIYYEWMYNIRDWCISRQLWWGHRIPAWYCGNCQHITVAKQDPDACQKCGSKQLEQDQDVLDTWFSSGLWPFSTLGWPDQTVDLATYYPTTLLITGFDILFFWVARMIMLGIECTGQVPFRQVYIHGLVRDAEKQKMSKTKGNTVDPLEITEKYGTDACRMALLTGAAPGTDIAFGVERVESARAFANKIWNASRLIFLNMDRSGVQPFVAPDADCCQPEVEAPTLKAPLEDRWIFSRLNHTAEQVNRALEQFRYHEVAQTLWSFFWHEFCDWYLEVKKLRLQEHSGLTADWRNLLTVYERALRLLHPVMPFITEELWQRLAEGQQGLPSSISLTQYPQYTMQATDLESEHHFEVLQGMITAVREMRADLNIDRKVALTGTLCVRDGAVAVSHGERNIVEALGNVQLQVEEGHAPKLGLGARSTPAFDLILDLPAGQAAAQRARLEKENAQLAKQIENHERQLNNESFVSRAPAHIIDGMRAKLAEYKAQVEKNQAALG